MFGSSPRSTRREPKRAVQVLHLVVERFSDTCPSLLSFRCVDSRLFVTRLLEEICKGGILVLGMRGDDVNGWG